jgi:hypothetical protein
VWGGLSRTTTPEGLTLYLCDHHVAQYRQPGAARVLLTAVSLISANEPVTYRGPICFARKGSSASHARTFCPWTICGPHYSDGGEMSRPERLRQLQISLFSQVSTNRK